MAKKVILGVLALIVFATVILSVVVAMQPAELKVTRSLDINAPSERIFEQVNDFRKWEAWSPWAKLDPNMKTTFSGPDSGVGASYGWIGNDEVGEGKMTIKNTHPPKYLAIDLEFIKPFEAKNLTQFDFKAMGEKTNVTWTMVGKKNFMMKAFCLVMDMDVMIGSDFEKGLAQLNAVFESPKVSESPPAPVEQSAIQNLRSKIQSLDRQGTIVSDVRSGDSEKWAVIEVTTQWHYTPKGARLELAKAFQNAWSSYSSDGIAPIEIKDKSGNKIGGSTLLGDVYVDD